MPSMAAASTSATAARCGLSNSTVQENYAEYAGGGIYNAGTLTVINSTLSDNDAGEIGGGIYNYEGAVAVLNSTLSGNYAGIGGGDITTEGARSA